MNAMHTAKAQPGYARARGVALILVMWITALMAILLGSFALIARTENLEARHMFDTTTARYAALAGLERAVFEMRNPNLQTRWVPDGRVYEFGYEGAQVSVSITDESGKIDLNVADNSILVPLLMSVGVDAAKADALADAIQDWHDADDVPRAHGAEAPQYAQAGLPYVPTNRMFQTVSEVQQVLGMTYEIFRRIEPAITVYSNARFPNAAFAPLEALRAIPGMTDELARQIIATRQAMPPGTSGALSGLTLPGGAAIMASGGSSTYSIKSRATLPNGVSTVFDASVRVGGVGNSGRPYTVLRWRDGENE